MSVADFLVIGGGVAGLSAAALLARHGKTIVFEAEAALGYHSSGRSVSFSHFGIGGAAVKGLTAYSRRFFEEQEDGFCATSIAGVVPSLYFATQAELPALATLQRDMARFTSAIEEVGEAEMAALCPVLKVGSDSAVRGLLDKSGLKLDADALLHSFARTLRQSDGELVTGCRIAGIESVENGWTATDEKGERWSAPILVNAAGAWADQVAELAGVAPLGLEPKRRTIIVVAPPAGTDPAGWPFILSAANDFYMLTEAGRLLVSPVDEVASSPCDAAPEDYDIALAADRLQHYTSIAAPRIAHRWAGLRSFVADRVPTAGFAADAPGFFWLAGQGGYGLQTAPAMAEIAEALITGSVWPAGLSALGVEPGQITPDRLRAAFPGGFLG